MAINWGSDYPYGYLDDEPVSPKVKPEPEPNWRSLYEDAQQEIKALKEEMKEMRQDLLYEMRELDERRF